MSRTPESRGYGPEPRGLRITVAPADRDIIDGVQHRIVERWDAGGYTACRAVPVDQLASFDPARPWIPKENPRYAAWAKAEAARERRAAEQRAAIEQQERQRSLKSIIPAAEAASQGDVQWTREPKAWT